MTEPSFADHFSGSAADYARFRPDYPPALFEWLGNAAPTRGRVWDCATGSGQAAVALAAHFADVIATDASAAQLAAAASHPRVRYHCAPAESSALEDASVDAVTVAQALHWLDLDRFYGEVKRVAKPGAVVAVWAYGPIEVEPRIDEVIGALYYGTLGSHWPRERAHVDNGYRDLAFPFERIEVPHFEMMHRWTLDEVRGYIGTWSAVQRYRKAAGDRALEPFDQRLRERWGKADQVREVRWPLIVNCGRVATTRPDDSPSGALA